MAIPEIKNKWLRTILRWDVLGFAASILLFSYMPTLDLKIAYQYYNGEFFQFEENAYVQFVYWFFGNIHFVFFVLFVYLALHCFYKDKHELKKKYLFLVCCLLLGPGLVVNLFLQNNSFGRPRPVNLVDFGGPHHYAAPFEYSTECQQNCSFVSGRASMAFFILAVAWVRQRPVWIMYGCILGVTVGFVRIIQGGNFLSDIVFSFWATWFSCLALAKLMGLTISGSTSHNNNHKSFNKKITKG